MLFTYPAHQKTRKKVPNCSFGLRETTFGRRLSAKVYELILVTAHKELAQECNKQFVADIDLSSFGVDWEEFLRDTKAVREEQADNSDAVFYPAHAKFLNSLLGRPRIFGTEFFYGRYEQRAKENITRILADLARNGYT
jgi:predicted metal-dependent HD superfamily phosphohydrolase